MPSKVMFSIMWPKVELKTGDELTRDYIYGLKDDFLRKFRSIPWNEEETNEELAGYFFSFNYLFVIEDKTLYL